MPLIPPNGGLRTLRAIEGPRCPWGSPSDGLALVELRLAGLLKGYCLQGAAVGLTVDVANLHS